MPNPRLAETPSLWRRWMVAVYESVILFGLYVTVGLIVLPLFQWNGALTGMRLSLYQFALFVTFGIYFTYCWTRGGQTLPMKTLDLQVRIANSRDRLDWGRAWLRYCLAWSGLLAGAAVLVVDPAAKLAAFAAFAITTAAFQAGAVFGPRHQALHDLLLGTEVVVLRH